MDNNKKFWDKVASLYTKLQEKGNKQLYADACSYIENYLSKNMIALELACGTGQFSIPLHECVKYYLASDFSEKMIEELNSISKHEDLITKVIDCTAIDLPDESFDVVIIANALHVMPQPEKAMQEIYRVLKPGGLLIAPTFIYEGKINKFKLWFLEKVGFKTFTKWTSSTFKQFAKDNNFHVIDTKILPGKLAPECILIANK